MVGLIVVVVVVGCVVVIVVGMVVVVVVVVLVACGRLLPIKLCNQAAHCLLHFGYGLCKLDLVSPAVILKLKLISVKLFWGLGGKDSSKLGGLPLKSNDAQEGFSHPSS